MNAILEKTQQVAGFTDLNDVFRGIGNIQNAYNWLITDLECNHYPDNCLLDNTVWLSGEDLTALVRTHDIQFIWAVLSGFPKHLDRSELDMSIVPYANSNPAIWYANAKPQHPQADIEIICWDSTSTLVISENTRIIEHYKQTYSDARDLDQRNELYSE